MVMVAPQRGFSQSGVHVRPNGPVGAVPVIGEHRGFRAGVHSSRVLRGVCRGGDAAAFLRRWEVDRRGGGSYPLAHTGGRWLSGARRERARLLSDPLSLRMLATRCETVLIQARGGRVAGFWGILAGQTLSGDLLGLSNQRKSRPPSSLLEFSHASFFASRMPCPKPFIFFNPGKLAVHESAILTISRPFWSAIAGQDGQRREMRAGGGSGPRSGNKPRTDAQGTMAGGGVGGLETLP